MRYLSAVVLSVCAVSAQASTLPGVGTFTGNAGFGTPNGDVSASPVGGSYVYISTYNSVSQTGLGLGSETNGTMLTTNAFDAEVGDELSYYFNFITSDGAGFSDYAYVQLQKLGEDPFLIFTARTRPEGDIVPGFGLPDIADGVTLVPSSSEIIPLETNWSFLGDDSGTCFAAGCGQTDWIQSLYTIEEAGSYALTFGVVNWSDTAYDSGLAVTGVTVGDVVIIGPETPVPIPLPAAGWTLLGALFGLGALRRKRTA